MSTQTDHRDSLRRDFLKTGAGVAALGLAQTGRVLGANDRVRLAICGLRGRGNDHLKGFSKVPGVEIAAVCDIDENVLAGRLADIEKMGLPKPTTYGDVRKLLEDKSIDAISVATPNHWHSLMGIWACQAGKDAYVEKPISHNVWEGRQLVAGRRTLQPDRAVRFADPLERGRPGSHGASAKRADRGSISFARPVLQVARHHRPQAEIGRARRRRLQPLAGPRAGSRIHRESVSLQLALVLG